MIVDLDKVCSGWKAEFIMGAYIFKCIDKRLLASDLHQTLRHQVCSLSNPFPNLVTLSDSSSQMTLKAQHTQKTATPSKSLWSFLPPIAAEGEAQTMDEATG